MKNNVFSPGEGQEAAHTALVRESLDRLCLELGTRERTRSLGPTGFDAALWDRLVEMGIPAMAGPEDQGGGGASMDDLLAVVSVLGRHLASVPMIEMFVAVRLAARLELAALPTVLASGSALTLSLQPVRGGTATLVPAAAVAAGILVCDAAEARWLDTSRPDVVVAAVASELGVGPVGDLVGTAGAEFVASGDAVVDAWVAARDDWRLLAAAQLVGAGSGALADAVAYVQERRAFGGPIARFQTIQHRLADRATDLAAADLLIRRAATEGQRDGEGEARSVLVPMASWLAGHAADAAAREALHFHGGYGFTEEYDAQLFLRRVTGLRLLTGDPDEELDEVAARLVADPEVLERGLAVGRSTPANEAFRTEVRAFIADTVTDDMIEAAHASGTLHAPALHEAMARRGWLGAWWGGAPTDDDAGIGDQDTSDHDTITPGQVVVLLEELQRVGAPIDGTGIAMMVATTLRHVGNETQLTEVLPAILGGRLLPCLGYSEPDAGSDVAAVTTRAVRDGDDWVIDGQKMFTTLAEAADVVFLLARTDPSGPKHQGLTLFLVPMDAPGVELRAMGTLGGERTNVTFYDGVRVPDSARVGPVDGGWSVMSVALAFERNSAVLGSVLRVFDLGWAWANTLETGQVRPLDRVGVARTLARVAIDCEAAAGLGDHAGVITAAGQIPVVEGSMTKLFTTERYQADALALLNVLGAEGIRAHGDDRAPAQGWVEHAARHAIVTTIAAGTSEIQREIIAQRGLGLPRDR